MKIFYHDVSTTSRPILLLAADEGITLALSLLTCLREGICYQLSPQSIRTNKLKERARVNELMNWFNTRFYRDLGYNFIYPQTLPKYKRKEPNAQMETLAWGREKSQHWLDILDRDIIGANAFLCGSQISISD